MNKSKAIIIAACCLIAVLVLIFTRFDHKEPKSIHTLPWQIKINSDKRLQVFDLTLGVSNLHEAKGILGGDFKLGLFRDREGKFSAEAFFDRVVLNGLRAKMVLGIEADQLLLGSMFERAIARANLANKSVKAEPDQGDQQALLQKPIASILYVPAARLDPSLLERQFGKPQSKIKESDEVSHWLYPEKGLDIVINSGGRVVFQYLNPDDFAKLGRSLEKN